MSRHAAPLDTYTETERVARLLHDRMLADALAHLDGLSAAWAAPSGKPYALDPTTGTLVAILTA